MLRTLYATIMMTVLFAGQVFAQDRAARIDALYDALGLPEIIEVMQQEGISYGAELGAEMFPDGGGQGWRDAVAAIYDPVTMHEEVRGAFGEAVMDADIDSMLDFFTSDRGRRIVALEVSARRALLDDAVEAASKEIAAEQIAAETPLYLAVSDFIATNDLIDSNVVGAMNASFAFYMGMIDGGMMPPGIDAETALRDVQAQEPEIRANTTEWVYAFLIMAYEPLPPDDLGAYQAFSATDAGNDLNDALFLAFDGLFEDISRALGLAASRFMVGEEL